MHVCFYYEVFPPNKVGFTLYNVIIFQERPKLESERSQLLESIANDLTALRDLEDRSLGLLQKSEGHILDDQDLVETLQKSKGMSGEIEKRITQSEEAEKKLNVARKKYLPVSTSGGKCTCIYIHIIMLYMYVYSISLSLSYAYQSKKYEYVSF